MIAEVKDYLERAKASVAHFAINSAPSRSSAEAIKAMLCALDEIEEYIEEHKDGCKALTTEDLNLWKSKMQNEDGTVGGHWTIDQTTSVASGLGIKFEHFTPEEFNTAMNMMYSDYYPVAVKFNQNNANFYAELAKAFLCDKDAESPSEKLAEYYQSIII